MCGLVGFISSNQISINQLLVMTDSISHRGPDGSGHYINKFGELYWGLGHRRLSIIDVDTRSDQPFFNKSKNIALTYNGEIYNYIELKQELKEYNFITESDTEVILALYEKYGIEFDGKLDGIFSFSISDFSIGKTFLVRDRHGVKPLYFFYDESNLVYASELRPILKYPFFSKELDNFSVELMLSLSYIPGNRSIFSSVKKVTPGSIMVFIGTRFDKEISYWDSIDTYLKQKKEQHSLSNYSATIDDAVQQNLVGDVEVATLLSSGIDSSTVLAFAKNYSSEIKNFTIGFDDINYDESIYANEFSKRLGVQNISRILSIEQLANTALNVARYCDEPLGDISLLPTLQVSKLVKDSSIKVVLSGDGGDEFFLDMITMILLI